MTDRTTRVFLQLVTTQYQAEMAKVAATTRAVGRDIGTFGKNSQNEFKMLGVAGLAAGTAVGFGLRKAVTSAMDFDRVISNVGAVSGATSKELGALRDAALEAGKATVFTASDSAKAEAELAKAGVSVSNILGGALTGSLNLAAAGQLDVADAASIAATAMVQFGKDGSAVPHIADLLAAAANEAQGGVQDMALALSYVGPVAAQMNVSLEETAGTIALLAHNGVLGERAGSSLRGMLTALTSPSAMATKEMQKLGIVTKDGTNRMYDATGAFVGFNGVAGLLHDTMVGLTEDERNQALGRIFGNEQITAARVLYQGGAAAVAEWTDKVNKDGEAARIAGKNMDNLAGDLEQLRGSIETALIQGGTEATGVLRFLAQGATETVNAFASLPGPVQGGVMAITAIAGSAALVGGAAIIAVPKIQAFNLALMEMATAPAASAATTTALTGLSAGIRGIGAALGYLVPTAVVAFGTFQLLNATLGADHDISKSWDHLRDSFTATAGALTDATRAAVAAHIESLGMTSAFAKAGVTVDALYGALASGKKGFDEWRLGLEAAGVITKEQDALLGGFWNALQIGKDKGVEFKTVLGETAGAMGGLGSATGDTTDALKTYSDALDAVFGSSFSVQEATDKVDQDIQSLASSIFEARAAGEKFAGTLDATSQRGLENRSALRGLVQDVLDVGKAMAEQGEPPEAIAAMFAAQRDRLFEVTDALGISRNAAAGYIDMLLQAAGINVTNTVVLHTEQAIAALQTYMNALYATGNLQDRVLAGNLGLANSKGFDVSGQVPGMRPTAPSIPLTPVAPLIGDSRRTATADASKKAADDAKKAADERKRQEEELNRFLDAVFKQRMEIIENQYKAGKISSDAYLKSLDEQMAREKPWTSAWLALQQKKADVFIDAQKAIQDAQQTQFEVGALSKDKYLAILRERLAGLKLYSSEWKSTWDEIHKIENDTADKSNDAVSKLQSLLDDEQKIRKQMADAADAHRKKLAEINKGFLADQQAALDERRQQLLGWARIDEQAVINWGNTAAALTANVLAQSSAFAEWADGLDALRRSGVSETVIGMLGLDEGPQMLGQVRSLSTATQAEIAALNAGVEARSSQASARVAAEQQVAYSKISQTLKGITERYAAEVEAETEAFLATQRDLNDQLAGVGFDGASAFGQAIADGLNSKIPAIVAAAQAAQKALLLANGSGSTLTAQPVSSNVNVSGSTPVVFADGKLIKASDLAFFGAKPNADGTWTVPTGSLPSHAVGTPFVDHTGPANIHYGERVLSAVDNVKLVAAYQSMAGGSSRPVMVMPQFTVNVYDANGHLVTDDRMRIVVEQVNHDSAFQRAIVL